MSEAKSVLSIVLLTLQFCLGFWQIVKLTLLGAVVKGYLALWMSMLPWGRLGSLLFPTYTRLKNFEIADICSAIKMVSSCHAIQAADEPTLSRQIAGEISNPIKSSYLGESIDLERREGNKLFMDGKMAYYITDAIWDSLLEMGRLASLDTVFIQGHKQIGHGGVSGGVMDLCEVLDSLILENHVIKPLEYVKGLLPINMSVSEEKILKALNLAGLFLQTKKQVHCLIPILFSFTAAVLEFMTPLRERLYAKNTIVSCKSREEYKKLITFVSCMAKNRSTSMRCCSPNNKKKRVRVRWFNESLIQYVKSGFPDVYEVQLSNVVVK